MSGSGAQGAPKPHFAISTWGTSGRGLPFFPGGDRQAVPHISVRLQISTTNLG